MLGCEGSEGAPPAATGRRLCCVHVNGRGLGFTCSSRPCATTLTWRGVCGDQTPRSSKSREKASRTAHARSYFTPVSIAPQSKLGQSTSRATPLSSVVVWPHRAVRPGSGQPSAQQRVAQDLRTAARLPAAATAPSLVALDAGEACNGERLCVCASACNTLCAALVRVAVLLLSLQHACAAGPRAGALRRRPAQLGYHL